MCSSSSSRAPQKSDRPIGKETGAHNKTIARARDKGEDVGRIPHVETRTDTTGRSQPAKKAPTKPPGRRPAGTAKVRDDIGPASAGEIARKDAEIEELRNL